MVAAACPKCTIYLIEANSGSATDLQTAEVEAVTLGAHIVSNGWICSAPCLDSSDFDTPGVVYLGASSTSGYGETGEPSSFASVVSVGGTVLEKSGSTYNEFVWLETGAGCTTIAKPSWQHDPDCTTRTVNDISAVAVNVAAYDTYGYNGWSLGGGTVAAAGLNAGVFGLAGNASSQNAPEKFWTMSKKKRDKELHYISTGSDGSCGGEYLCQAGTKQYGTYSGPAGWGTPNGIKAY